MYYNDYEDYMRNVLGFSNMNDNTYSGYNNNYNSMDYCNPNYNMNYNRANYNNLNYDNMICNSTQTNQFQNRNNFTSTEQIEQMYPEIYKLINPTVCQRCDNTTQPITEQLIEQMTDDIYDNVVNRIEVQNVININVETRESDLDREEADNRSLTSPSGSKINQSNSKSCDNCQKMADSIEEVRETRSPVSQNQQRRRNRLLRDLIRILILNRLLRRNRPNRPPFRPGMNQGMMGYMPRMNSEYIPYM